jgi:hypothetical protein
MPDGSRLFTNDQYQTLVHFLKEKNQVLEGYKEDMNIVTKNLTDLAKMYNEVALNAFIFEAGFEYLQEVLLPQFFHSFHSRLPDLPSPVIIPIPLEPSLFLFNVHVTKRFFSSQRSFGPPLKPLLLR